LALFNPSLIVIGGLDAAQAGERLLAGVREPMFGAHVLVQLAPELSPDQLDAALTVTAVPELGFSVPAWNYPNR
jgi:hypothetical protein